MRLSRIGRISMALVVSVAMGLGMTACGGGTIGFMWVLGTQYNQIAGFKIDDFTGNLTQIIHSPFASGGANPVSLVVTPGGRFVYVINKGTGSGPAPSGSCGGAGGGIVEFSVGGGGILTFQQCFVSQGTSPVWAVRDSTGGYLFVLDQFAPGSACAANGQTETPGSCFGDITVFSIASDTGRLTLVLNQQVLVGGAPITYFPVGKMPSMMQLAGGGCLMTLDRGDQTVFPYSVNGGQLTRPTNSTINLNSINATSISANGSAVYITDAGATSASPGGYILPYTVGTSCALNTANGGAVANLPLTSNPSYSLTDTTGQFVYVLNQSTTNSNAPSYSSISAFYIDPTSGKLKPLPDQNNPYKVGSGPVCMVEDPTSQWMYTSNSVDGTVTGKSFYKPYGTLSDLKRGSTFTATGQPTCLAISPNVE